MTERPLLVRIFFDELPLKLVALVISVTLFVIVRSDKDAASGAYVKVIYTLPSDRVLTVDPVTEVRVGVRGSWTRLQRFDERAVDPMRVDLTRAQDGMFHFDESMVKLAVGLRVASITPSDVKLQFEPKSVREVPLQPILDGQPADGFRVAKVTSSPETVKIEGARSIVEALVKVGTTPFKVAGARMPVLGEVQLVPPPRFTRYVDPSNVVVQVEVQPALAERTFDALRIKVMGLQRLEGAPDPDHARLIVRGPSNLVLGVKLEQVSLQVDGALLDTRPPGKLLRNVTATGLPSGVAAEVQPDTVMLTTRRK